VDGVALLTPKQRLMLSESLSDLTNWTADPIRRTYISKGLETDEQRGLGIPTMRDRAMQALVKLAMEPEWEAQFEPNSYGFRPGRSAQDAIQAIFLGICRKPKYALDADIEKCFDRINHKALVEKLNAIQPITRLVWAWLRAGIVDKGRLLFPEEGTPQGGVLSPLLANVALHGLEQALISAVPRKCWVKVVRYADDVVVLCADLETLIKLKEVTETWLAEMGLRLKPSKTRITHTLNECEGNIGFDFLGFNVRQYRVGKYRTWLYRGKPGYKTLIRPSKAAVKRQLCKVRAVIHQHRGAPQSALISDLNPMIRGWALYYRNFVAKRTFGWMDDQVYRKLRKWAVYRHRRKSHKQSFRRYWQRQGGRWNFSDGTSTLARYESTPIVRHIKVKGDRSPYDGDWVYWGLRLGRDPTKPGRVIRLLKRQGGRCVLCGLRFMVDDITEVHHWDGDRTNNRYANLVLLHGHCHDQAHGKRC
jgi:RNA-directed DNA polymerase